MKKKLIIFGSGIIAELAYYYFTHDSEYSVVAFTNNKDFLEKNSFCKKPLVAFENIEEIYPPTHYDMFIAIGYKNRNRLRQEKYKTAQNKGYNLASYISSKATNFASSIGKNCLILENNVIQPFVEIGHDVILWSGNHIGHHSKIADHCFISSHVVISGGVSIGSHSFLGVNSTLRDGIGLGQRVIVGAGALVMQSCPDDAVFIQPRTPYKIIEKDLI